jgi:hypothetical protein
VFLIRPDGTIHMVALNSMPAARPHIEDLVQAIQFFIERDYPPGARPDRTVCRLSSL